MLDPSAIAETPVGKLQLGLAIELAVLPPYLYALWSIRSEADGGSPYAIEAARTIRGVVYEEMLHAAMAGNLISSLNGAPAVGKPPMTYPDKLPGHIKGTPGPGWVQLQPLSPGAVQAFMAIELPAWLDKTKPPSGWGTIADLYERIEAQLVAEKPTFSPVRQLPLGDNPGPGQLIAVASLADAKRAIDTIVDQGEGHQAAPHNNPDGIPQDDDDHEVAHYDQFLAINGYFGDGCLKEDEDIWPLVTDPKVADYDTDQKAANTAFNGVYSELLDSLEAMFAATSPRVYGPPTELMMELGHLARVLRNTGPLGSQPDKLPGPTFEYLPPSERRSR